MNPYPKYIDILKSGEFTRRVKQADSILRSCTSCPHNCNIDRTAGETGTCKGSHLPIVSSYTLHFGEEPVLSGSRGAGNIFFGNCNLSCVFCQNYLISQNYKVEKANEVSIETLSDIMLELQNRNAHNIGLVSPSHFAIQILKALKMAVEKGLALPIIYNSNGYDSVEILKLFNGIIDIYLPDFKYGDNIEGLNYSRVKDYYDRAKAAIEEMYNQVGSELVYKDEVIVRGLIIRHLILPNGLAESESVFKFIAGLDKNIHISLMAQYYPANKANNYDLINRSISIGEYSRALELLDKYGLHKGWIQELDSNLSYRPYFDESREDPFRNTK